MKYIKRDIEKIILETSQSFSAVLISGPRQVGKTTTLRYLMEESRTYISLDDLEARRNKLQKLSYHLQSLDHRHNAVLLPYEAFKQLYCRLLSAVT